MGAILVRSAGLAVFLILILGGLILHFNFSSNFFGLEYLVFSITEIASLSIALKFIMARINKITIKS